MNQQFKELAILADLYVDVNGQPWPRNMNGEDIEGAYQKFAELIVQECMSIANQVENDKFDVAGSAEPEYRKGINDGRRNAAWGIKNRMKLHFGVEA